MSDVRQLLASVPPEPGAPKPDPILLVDGIRRAFGGLLAVDIEHLEIQRDAITGLIGPNGAGKTSFFNLVTGFDRADRGSWVFEGQDLAGTAPHDVARRGMVRTFQLTRVLSRLSVLDNMKLGATAQVGERIWSAPFRALWRSQEAAIEDRADELLRRFQLDHMRGEFAATLSGGQRKLLEMARSLMVEPRLVMLDEPMAGVNRVLNRRLLDHVLELPSRGMTVVFVEHDMDVVMTISDWVVCLAAGRVIAEGPPETIASNEDVIEAYLGARHDEPDRPPPIRKRDETGE